MQFKNVTRAELDQALRETNKEFDNNVTWNNPYATLRVKNSHNKGARLSYMGRHITSACWHVHGIFFEKLLKINPKAVIVTSMAKIDKQDGNWQDRNIGSLFNPLMYSKACECEGTTGKELRERFENLFKR